MDRPRPSKAPRLVPPEPQQEPPGAYAAGSGSLECPVDGTLAQAGEKQASRWYLFTQVTEDEVRPGRKTPEDVGREGLYNALVETYHKVFKPGHLCHVGPDFCKVVQEGHPNSTVDALKNLHNHAACQFPVAHKWKAVEKYLREAKGIKVHVSKHPCYRTAYDYISTATQKKPESEIDKDFFMSPGHPPIEELPQPDPQMLALWRARSEATKEGDKKEESMKVLEFYDVVRGLAQSSRTEDALFVLATAEHSLTD